MDVTGSFFNKLRTLAVTLEKQIEQLKHVFHADGTELDDDSPMRYLHELHSDVRTLKGDADNTLCKSSSERDTTYDFIKASKVLMKRNATVLEEIRDLFQKYGYKPVVSKDAATKDEAEVNSASATFDQEEPKDLVCPGKSSGPYSPLHIPQLSDFGLSKYALPSTAGTMPIETQAHVQKEEPQGNTSGCLSPKAETFHIHGRDLCLNDETTTLVDDQTIFLLNNSKNIRQSKTLSESVVISAAKNLDTPKQADKLCDYMASPAAPEFCTPGVKIPHKKKTVLPKSSESNNLDASDCVTRKLVTDSQAQQTDPQKTTEEPNNCLEYTEEPRPPAISDYTNLISTPPPPEITVIPDQIFQILSKYNPKGGVARSVEKQANEGIATQVEGKLVLNAGNKENWKHSG
ncbi:hypothetical protein JRQ81_019692 [Phrynocephalus forsythii]|uniref:Spindle and kinetochore-associated protein 3 n=1 Tax=Phrynocephalus forsythii TaxID=171643 RepID=A0A9Q1AYR9_9SAUR|nr:hypothetical protein JRQ81_019692 [Phrynocephalus forsythii]